MKLPNRFRSVSSNPGMIDDRLDAQASHVMLQAALEAYRLNHSYLGTEHVLLGLVSEDAARSQRLPDVDLHLARAAVERELRRGHAPSFGLRLPPTGRLKAMIELAAAIAHERSTTSIAPTDLWDALFAQSNSCGTKIARALKSDR